LVIPVLKKEVSIATGHYINGINGIKIVKYTLKFQKPEFE